MRKTILVCRSVRVVLIVLVSHIFASMCVDLLVRLLVAHTADWRLRHWTLLYCLCHSAELCGSMAVDVEWMCVFEE
jgi:hypothetical protein